jgi:hypothetical protein
MSAPSLDTYGGAEFAAGLPGNLYGAITPIIRSRRNEGAIPATPNTTNDPIDFGIAIARGTVSDACRVVDSNSDVVIGISLREAIIGPASTDGNNTINFARNANVPFLGGPGGVRVVPCEDVRDGDQVVAVVAQGGRLAGTKGGVIGVGRLEVKGYIWDGACASGVLGKVRYTAGEVATLTT